MAISKLIYLTLFVILSSGTMAKYLSRHSRARLFFRNNKLPSACGKSKRSMDRQISEGKQSEKRVHCTDNAANAATCEMKEQEKSTPIRLVCNNFDSPTGVEDQKWPPFRPECNS